jgi:hypothetical protein
MKVPIGAALVRRGAGLVNPRRAPLKPANRAGSATPAQAARGRAKTRRWREIWFKCKEVSSLDVTLP